MYKIIVFIFGVTFLYGNSLGMIRKSEGVLSPEDLRYFKELFHLSSFIETGTYSGDTTFVAATVFPEVYSIEIWEPLYLAAQKRFAHHSNVHLYFGDTALLLTQMIQDSPPGKRLYWLDAHCSGGGTGGTPGVCPIPDELEQIFAHGDFESIILIDDLRGWYHCDERSNLPLREMIRIVKDANPDLQFYSIGDIGIIYHEKSYPFISVSPLVRAASFSRFFDPQCEDEEALEKLIDAECFIGNFGDETREGKNFHSLVKFADFHEGLGGEVVYLLWEALYELQKNELKAAIRDLQIVANSPHAHWRIDAYLVKALRLEGRLEEAQALFETKLAPIAEKYSHLIAMILNE